MQVLTAHVQDLVPDGQTPGAVGPLDESRVGLDVAQGLETRRIEVFLVC